MKVLIAPLNWGVGHSTRCIPVIRQLLREGREVHIASDGPALDLLKAYFPKCTFHPLKELKITYTRSLPLYFKFPSIAIKLFMGYLADRRSIRELQEKEKYDIILSDSRFGIYSKSARSYIIIHQFRLIGAGGLLMEWLSDKAIKHFLKPFRSCLIPDYEGENNLSGSIAKPVAGKPAFYLKPLSRFPIEGIEFPLPKYNLLVILSGPEPQRTKLEEIVLQLASESNKSIMLLRGTKNAGEITVSPNVRVFDYAGDSMMQSLIHNSDLIVCRAGYSSIMDLHALGRGAILVPTPNQPEQEYLAKWLDGKYGFTACRQSIKELEIYF